MLHVLKGVSAVDVQNVDRIVRKVRARVVKAHLEEVQVYLRIIGRGGLLHERIDFLAGNFRADIAAPHIDCIDFGVQLKISHGLTEGKERAAVLTAEFHQALRPHKLQ